MKEISRAEGQALIKAGKAGFYSVNANPPVPHNDQMVVYTARKWYLCTADEIKVTESGPVLLRSPVDGSPLPKMAYTVTVTDGTELCAMLREEMEGSQDVDLGAGIRSKYSGHPGRPEINN